MCNGPIFKKLMIFFFPLMLSGILQLLFNAADIIVVGRFAGSEALAAVGSTSSLIHLIINLFIGLSVGANVLAARFYGAGQKKDLSEMVHTAIMTSFIAGFILVIIGVLVARPVLELMDTPANVIDHSVLYMQIYFVGMPVTMAYNFGAAILRAVGDTRRPLYYLSAAGILNVGLNLFFVIVFHMGVAGVALATIISQALSAVLVLRCMMLSEGDYQLRLKQLRIVPDKLKQMMRIGVPAGLQSCLFSFSNVIIQSSVNSFGSIAMAGNTAAQNLENFVYISMNAFYQTTISFASQNYGAKKYKRVGKIVLISLGMVSLIGLVLGNGCYFFSSTLLKLYSSDAEVIKFGMLRLSIIATTYFLCGTMEVAGGALRGIGYSIIPMVVSLIGACLMRIVWIYTIFQQYHSLESIYISYPISWILTTSAHLLVFIFAYRKLRKSENVMKY